MPVEAIHISAFLDSLAASRAPGALRAEEFTRFGRLGAVVIDFPYFDRFPVGVMRYLLERPTAQSSWGDAIHKGTPVVGAERMLERARALRLAGRLRESRRLLALALGYISHVAVDRALHPSINRMARARAARMGGEPAHHHTEIEKFHSVLFHEERLGFDFMGKPALRAHIEVDGHALHREPWLFEVVDEALAAVAGRAPGRALLARWARGYGQYVWLVSSPVGKRIVPEATKRRVHGELYRGPWGAFTDAYASAVACSREAIDAALGWVEASPAVAAEAREVFRRVVPEGPIDLE